jgi:hypothetical protein
MEVDSMNTDVWKKIKIATYYFIGIICFGYIIDTLLYKFGFEQTGPKIYDNISAAFGGAVASIFFIKDGSKKFDIYLLIILIILAIGVYFLIHN